MKRHWGYGGAARPQTGIAGMWDSWWWSINPEPRQGWRGSPGVRDSGPAHHPQDKTSVYKRPDPGLSSPPDRGEQVLVGEAGGAVDGTAPPKRRPLPSAEYRLLGSSLAPRRGSRCRTWSFHTRWAVHVEHSPWLPLEFWCCPWGPWRVRGGPGHRMGLVWEKCAVGQEGKGREMLPLTCTVALRSQVGLVGDGQDGGEGSWHLSWACSV